MSVVSYYSNRESRPTIRILAVCRPGDIFVKSDDAELYRHILTFLDSLIEIQNGFKLNFHAPCNYAALCVASTKVVHWEVGRDKCVD